MEQNHTLDALKISLDKANNDLKVAQAKVKKIKERVKSIKLDIKMETRKDTLYRYQEKVKEYLSKYNAFWNSIKDSSNAELKCWQEELDKLPELARMKDWANLPVNNADMEIFFKDSLCSYHISYVPVQDPIHAITCMSINCTDEPLYYLLVTNLLAGDFVEKYIPARGQSIQELLLTMYNLNILDKAEQDILAGKTDDENLSLFYGKEPDFEWEIDEHITELPINDIKSLFVLWEKRVDGRYYPTDHQSYNVDELIEKSRSLTKNE